MSTLVPGCALFGLAFFLAFAAFLLGGMAFFGRETAGAMADIVIAASKARVSAFLMPARLTKQGYLLINPLRLRWPARALRANI